MQKSVLIIMPDRCIRETLCQFISSEGFECHSTENTTRAMGYINKKCYDVLITDLDLYKFNGDKFLVKTPKRPCHPFVIYIVPYIDRYIVEKLQEKRGVDFLVAPIDFNQLLNLLNNRLCSDK